MADLMQQARDIEAALRAEVGKQRNPLRPLFMNSTGRLMNDAANVIAALRAAPEGFVMVPVEPTQEMLDAGGPWNTEMDEPPDFPALRCIWRDMLAARPQGVK